MSTSIKRGARIGAFGVAAAMAAGGLMAAPAVAAEDKTVTLDEAFAEFQSVAGVHGVTADAEGTVYVHLAGASDEDRDRVTEFGDNVEVREFVEAPQQWAENEVVGGAGYLAHDGSNAGYCSVGFTAWSPEGAPAAIGAGHCTSDGAMPFADLTLPSEEPAAGGPGAGLWQEFGDFVFSQNGGPGNSESEAAQGGETDVSVIEVVNPDLELLPAVTDWSTAAQDDLAASTVPVTGVAEAVEGPVQKSGRTTGFTSGEVVDTNGYFEIEGRWAQGFGSIIEGAPGDSGGAVIQGGNAVGLVKGGGQLSTGETYMWSAGIINALDVVEQNVGEYTLMLDIAEPTLDTDSIWAGTSTVAGEAPGAETLAYAFSDGGPTGEASVSNGAFTIDVSDVAPGDYTVELQSASGYNESDIVEVPFEVKLGGPQITSPADGATVTQQLYTVQGTGVPGATVTTAGASEAEVEVDENGQWIAPITQRGYGEYTVTAAQTYMDVTAETTSTVTFTYAAEAPSAPTVITPADGAQIVEGEVPAAIVGESEYDGATVNVEITGGNIDELTEAEAAEMQAFATSETVVEAGTWMTDLPAGLEPATYTIAVSQTTTDGLTSATATTTFDVVEAPAEAPGGSPEEPGDDGQLAPTGIDGAGIMPFAAGAIVLMLAGAGLIAYRVRTAAARS